jgi:hypothetical protein
MRIRDGALLPQLSLTVDGSRKSRCLKADLLLVANIVDVSHPKNVVYSHRHTATSYLRNTLTPDGHPLENTLTPGMESNGSKHLKRRSNLSRPASSTTLCLKGKKTSPLLNTATVQPPRAHWRAAARMLPPAA